VVTVHNAVKETIRAHLILVHIFHAYVSADTSWVDHALSHFTPVRYGRITSVSAAHKATQFAGPHKIPYASVHNSNLLIGVRRSVLNRHRRGYHLGATNFRSDHSSFLVIQYSPFSPNCPVRSPIMSTFDHFAKPHRTSIDRKSPITSGFQLLVFYR
jgi:hypothetical protein